MFSSLSFKLLKRRFRLPFTLFKIKKRGKNSKPANCNVGARSAKSLEHAHAEKQQQHDEGTVHNIPLTPTTVLTVKPTSTTALTVTPTIPSPTAVSRTYNAEPTIQHIVYEEAPEVTVPSNETSVQQKDEMLRKPADHSHETESKPLVVHVKATKPVEEAGLPIEDGPVPTIAPTQSTAVKYTMIPIDDRPLPTVSPTQSTREFPVEDTGLQSEEKPVLTPTQSPRQSDTGMPSENDFVPSMTPTQSPRLSVVDDTEVPSGNESIPATVLTLNETELAVEDVELQSEDEPVPTGISTQCSMNLTVEDTRISSEDGRVPTITLTQCAIESAVDNTRVPSEDELVPTMAPTHSAAGPKPIPDTQSGIQNKITDAIMARQKAEQNDSTSSPSPPPSPCVKPITSDEPTTDLRRNEVCRIGDEAVVKEQDTAPTHLAEPKADEESTQPKLIIRTNLTYTGDNSNNIQLVQSPAPIEEPLLTGSEDKPLPKVIAVGKSLTEPVDQFATESSVLFPKSAASPKKIGSFSPRSPKRQDSDIMAELQASVRSRESKRMEREAAEKEKTLQELGLATHVQVTEDGRLRASDSNSSDPGDVRQEVRLWRKDRENSLKSVRETARSDAAKTAACRAASSGEEIMTELLSARSLRSPCFPDPREKRQLLLEEVYQSRVMVAQGV